MIAPHDPEPSSRHEPAAAPSSAALQLCWFALVYDPATDSYQVDVRADDQGEVTLTNQLVVRTVNRFVTTQR